MLAAAGLGSRRACEEFIAAGRVTVDGQVARLGDRVDPRQASVVVDGAAVAVSPDAIYLVLNKPRGMVTSMTGQGERASVGDVVARVSPDRRLFHVGRLDADSEGLLLLTNDGALAHRLSHPSFEVPKTYLVEVAGAPAKRDLAALRAGVPIGPGETARADSVRVVDRTPQGALVELVLHDGRTHVVRRMMEAVGHPARRLLRTRVGPLALGELRPGQTRHLSQVEVSSLLRISSPTNRQSAKSSDRKGESDKSTSRPRRGASRT